jgi:hypothetical protein
MTHKKRKRRRPDYSLDAITFLRAVKKTMQQSRHSNLRVLEAANGTWLVIDGLGQRVAGPFDSNSSAWAWIDRRE